ncbi:hypothetical protein [Streptomyces olivaceiscleroticus]|uniref:Uncharacterized protein n=1 Tax=Streptomyces olivaceiscleroticus TaxID=68245 RepID=A0ABN1BFM2_9ACTN
MPQRIAGLFVAALRWLLPAPERHRTAAVCPEASPHRTHHPRPAHVSGEVHQQAELTWDLPLVRPYLLAHERRQEERRRLDGGALAAWRNGQYVAEVIA